mmetsp:Transcript_281/g.378  ORF Transcript_281/g.378 Transcript_281/m.378 type:complete len:232 (-) Transcript_281:1094-1789(-)
MGHVAWRHGLPAWRNPFERLYKTALVWEEHQGLIISITIWIHRIENLVQIILSNAHERALCWQVLVVHGRGDVVVCRDFAQIGVCTSLCFWMLRRVALELVGIRVLGHQIQATLSQLIQESRRAAHTGSTAAGPTEATRLATASFKHDVQQLRHLRPLEPQTILGDHETKLVPGRLHCQLHGEIITWPHVPVFVRQVNVPLLRNGKRCKPCSEEGDLACVLLPSNFTDAFC